MFIYEMTNTAFTSEYRLGHIEKISRLKATKHALRIRVQQYFYADRSSIRFQWTGSRHAAVSTDELFRTVFVQVVDLQPIIRANQHPKISSTIKTR